MPKITEKPLTDLAIRKAELKAERYELRDAMVRGLGVRISPSGTKTWFVMRRVNGNPIRVSLGQYPEVGLSEARLKAAEAVRQLREGKPARQAQPSLFEEVLEEWLERDQGRNRSASNVRNALSNHALPYLKGKAVDEVQRADILRLIDRLVEKGACTQANRVLAYLRRLFNWCVERDLIAASPVSGIKPRVRQGSRDRVLSENELGSVYKRSRDIDYPFGPIVQLLILTGQRLREVAHMRWSEVDLDQSIWMLPADRSKNGKPHAIHLSSEARRILAAIPQVMDSGWVFTTTGRGPVSGFSQAKKRLDKASGVSDWTFHDIRRSFATYLTEKLGVSPVVVDRILNHVSGTVTGIAAVYQRGQYLSDRKEALQVWSDYIQNLGDKPTPDTPRPRHVS